MEQNLVESEDNSNDTTTISELLKSADVMPPTQLVNLSSMTDKAGEKLDQQQQQQQIINVLIPSGAITSSDIVMDHNSNNLMAINQGYSDTMMLMEDTNKVNHLRHVNIPYILNGELYQIQTQEGENVTVKCCHCPPDRVYRGSVRSTGNFHMHIKRRHPDLLEKLHNMKVNALLERRDRLMRNRKISSRHNHRNRQSYSVSFSTFNNAQAVSPQKMENLNNEANLSMSNTLERSILPLTASSPKEFSALHKHKLKIKEVFERHQEAAEMRNWNSSQDDCSAEPINYSLKSQTKDDICLQHHQEQDHHFKSQQQLQNDRVNSDTTTHSVEEGYNNHSDNNNPVTVNECLNNGNLFDNKEYSIREISTSSLSQSSSTPSPIVFNKFSNIRVNNKNYNSAITITNNSELINNSNNNVEQSLVNQASNFRMRQYPENALSIIKPEHLLFSSEDNNAMDLSTRNDSGIFSDFTKSTLSSRHTSTSTPVANRHRAGSHMQNHLFSSNADRKAADQSVAATSSKWQDLLHQVESSLKDIQHEMNVRNQIETNRMFLDIAKFKFLHPGFQFNW